MKLFVQQAPENKPTAMSFIFAGGYWIGTLSLAFMSGLQSPTLEQDKIIPFYIAAYTATCLLVAYASFIRREVPIVIILNKFDTYRGKSAVALGLIYLLFTTILLFVFWP